MQRESKYRWDKEHIKTISFRLHVKKDADILARLAQEPNKQGYIKRLIRADIGEEMNKWIGVNERLPEHDFEDVLVCLHDKRKGLEDEFFVAEACLVRKRWSMTFPIDDNACLEVVAWMPLPAPPATSAPSSAAFPDKPASAPR